MARPPEQLGSLRLVRQLGVGRKCQIWEAADESQSKRVAVKLVSPESASDKSIRQLLKHELIVSKSLNHPGIIRMEALFNGWSTATPCHGIIPSSELKDETYF